MKRFALKTLFALLTSTSLFSFDVAMYSQNSSVQWTWAITALDGVTLPEDGKVLDIGSGDGKVAAYLASRLEAGEVIGIDPLDACLAFASEKFEHLPNLTFHKGRAEEVDFEEAFDLITGFCSFYGSHELPKVFANISKALKVGGQCVAVFPQYIPGRSEPFSEAEIRALVEDAGLEVVKVKCELTAGVFHDSEEYKNFFRSLKPDVAEEVLEERLKKVQSLFPQAGDGRVYVFPHKIDLIARKRG